MSNYPVSSVYSTTILDHKAFKHWNLGAFSPPCVHFATPGCANREVGVAGPWLPPREAHTKG
jgi:hypothetical protein